MHAELDSSNPRAISDRVTIDSEFIAEYRDTALQWAQYASLSGAVLFAVFMIIAWLAEPAAVSAQVVRGSLSLTALTFYFFLSRGLIINNRNYVVLVGGGAALALLGTVVIPILPNSVGDEFALRATPAIVCGLFVLYGFLRLPVAVAASTGVMTSVLAVMWAPVVTGGSEGLRTFVYLTFTNVVGVAISILIESRERELFYRRRVADAALKDASVRQRYAEEAEREKDQLIAAISHDLRQPMMAASSHLDVMQLRLSRDDLVGARSQITKVKDAVHILGATLDQLLVAARCEQGAAQLTLERIELAKLLNDVLEPVWNEAEKPGVDFRVKFPLVSVCIFTDLRSIRRVISNLVSNAVKFAQREDGGRQSVLLAVRVRSGYCQIDVIDTGVGIPFNRLDDVWKPFVQLGNGGRDREKGLGLGLFLVRRILDNLPQHSIELRSLVGRGSRFSMRVPMANYSSRMERETTASENDRKILANNDLSGTHILILEDDRAARVALVDLLDSFGASVVSGATAEDLLVAQRARGDRASAIVCDYRLGNGSTAPEELKGICLSLGYDVPAVVITGEQDIASLRSRIGNDVRVLQKPFEASTLAGCLQTVVATGQQR